MFLLFCILTLLLYYPTARAGFVTDFLQWQINYEKGSFADIINCFGYSGLHQFLHLVFYSLFRMLGRDSILWYVLFSIFHAGIAFTAFRVFQQIFSDFDYKEAGIVAFTGAFLFLINPYQTEVLVWRTCIHYIIMGFSFLWIIKLTHLWLIHQKTKHLIYLNLIFILALFSLELSLAIPFIVGFYTLVWVFQFQRLDRFIVYSAKLLLPLVISVISWFSLNKLFLGKMVGHYGAKTHFEFDLIVIFGNAFKFLTKYLFFQRYWKHDYKMNIWSYFDSSIVLIFLVGLGIISAILCFVYFRKLKTELRLVGLLLVLFFLALLPIINMYFYALLYIENDRYGYVASIFFCLMLAVILFSFPKILRYTGLSLFTFVSIYLTIQTNHYWHQSYLVHEKIIQQFDFYDHDKIVLLNVPENIKGAPIFLSIKDEYYSTIQETLPMKRLKPHKGEIIELAYFNLTDVNDGVNVKVKADDHLLVDCNQWGTWFWRKGIGASNYENDLYKVKFDLKHYNLYLKQPLKNTLFLYWNGNDWKRVER